MSGQVAAGAIPPPPRATATMQPAPDRPDRPDREADHALVARVRAGERGAFEQLVRDHQGLCWHVIQRMVRHPEDTRELCQEAFLRVHRYLHQWRGDSALKSWIAQVAYSVAKRHLEKKRIPLVEAAADDDADGDGALLERIAGEADVERDHEAGDAHAQLHAAIERLPPLQRTLLTLYHLEEMPIGEIAGVTGIAENTIKSHLFRARKALRTVLEPVAGVYA